MVSGIRPLWRDCPPVYLLICVIDVFGASSFVPLAPGADVWVEGGERHPLQASPLPPHPHSQTALPCLWVSVS